jgi:hypothetical protein
MDSSVWRLAERPFAGKEENSRSTLRFKAQNIGKRFCFRHKILQVLEII